jgi:hypothetical protein
MPAFISGARRTWLDLVACPDGGSVISGGKTALQTSTVALFV